MSDSTTTPSPTHTPAPKSWAQVVDKNATVCEPAKKDDSNHVSEGDYSYHRRERKPYDERRTQSREHRYREAKKYTGPHITPKVMAFCFDEIKLDDKTFNAMLYNEAHTSRNGRISRSWRMTYHQLRRAKDNVARKRAVAMVKSKAKPGKKREYKTDDDDFTIDGTSYSRHSVYAQYDFRQEARKYYQYLVDRSRSKGLEVQNFYDRNRDQGGLKVWFN